MPIPLALIPSLISAGSSILGGTAQNVLQGMNTRRMLKYNSPVAQIRRLREAGLPYAAAGQVGGQQSSPTPATDLGFTSAGKDIGQYQNIKKVTEEIGKIKEDIRREQLLNEKLEGELEWYRSGAGTDPSRTNLSYNMGIEQSYKALQNMGQGLTNLASSITTRNLPTKLNLENENARRDISNKINQNILGGYQIEGEKLNNALKDIELKWKPNFKAAELNSILLTNDIKVTDKGLKQLEYELNAMTFDNKVAVSNIERETRRIGKQILGLDYERSAAWQEFNRKTQSLFDDKNLSPLDRIRAVPALLYQIVGNREGKLQSPIFNFGQ